ncbi:S23 ribosomal protein OS=Nitrosococcus watsoni (strain C-113) GN=Nwat_0046 PE=4 SV=1: 23S_rRNA_IVP [Gemmataceae bacterium]|nr:S23 ribosomal protein OS=Nitrosococcus watsoni (strain C-113) GN=Nwat_0046 PE=4 SV=1: 23S_rRNA_IVP [Gemmataceae bacterium]VTT97678.1 S23 ribosomal protein OS=Nitrosococcus watsoni (strain C-113) GN=Nwat_0046 PE=4 SV=1: 23S_rRNA_IVP [Gemmataceae bacterium]
MATWTRFEELDAWKKARELNKRVYRLTRQPPMSKDYGLCDQMRRSSLSVMCNIAEGFERGSRNEFIQFLGYAKGSAGEVRAQLVAAIDAPYIDEATFEEMTALAVQVGQVIAGLIRYLQRSGIRGPRHQTFADAE